MSQYTMSCIDSGMLSPITESDHKGTMKKYLSRSATELDHSQFRTSASYYHAYIILLQ